MSESQRERTERIVGIVKESLKHTLRSPYYDDLEVVDYSSEIIQLNHSNYYFKIDPDRDTVRLYLKGSDSNEEEKVFAQSLRGNSAAFELALRMDEEILWRHRRMQKFKKMGNRMDRILKLRDEAYRKTGIEEW